MLNGCGGASVGEEGSRRLKMGARPSVGGRWGVEGALWPGFAARGRAPATRGQPLAPRGGSVLATVGHRRQPIGRFRHRDGRLTASFDGVRSLKPCYKIKNRN